MKKKNQKKASYIYIFCIFKFRLMNNKRMIFIKKKKKNTKKCFPYLYFLYS